MHQSPTLYCDAHDNGTLPQPMCKLAREGFHFLHKTFHKLIKLKAQGIITLYFTEEAYVTMPARNTHELEHSSLPNWKVKDAFGKIFKKN